MQHNTPFYFLARSRKGWRMNLDLVMLGQQAPTEESEEQETT